MSGYMALYGTAIFSLIVGVFLIVYLKKGLYEAVIIAAIFSTVGVMFIPDYPLFSFYIRIGGAWRYVVVDMLTVKIITIMAMVGVWLYMREWKAKNRSVIT